MRVGHDNSFVIEAYCVLLNSERHGSLEHWRIRLFSFPVHFATMVRADIHAGLRQLASNSIINSIACSAASKGCRARPFPFPFQNGERLAWTLSRLSTNTQRSQRL